MPIRRRLLTLIALGLVVPLTVRAQQGNKIWRVGLLGGGARPADGLPPAALRQALQKLGYVQGVNITYEARFAEGRAERLPGLAAELLDCKVDLIVARGGPAAMAAKRATSTIPIVLAPAAGDAVALGLMASLSRPGGNVTGLTDESAQLSAKRMELLKEVLPQSSRIAVIWNANDEGMTLRYREIEKAARALRMEVQPLEVREPGDFDAAFASMSRVKPDAIFLVSDDVTYLNRKRVIEFSTSRHIPSMFEGSSFVRDGGLLSYGYDADDSFVEAASYIDRIFKGTKAGELAAAQPMRYYLTVNRKFADQIGVKVPESLLMRSDEVLQ